MHLQRACPAERSDCRPSCRKTPLGQRYQSSSESKINKQISCIILTLSYFLLNNFHGLSCCSTLCSEVQGPACSESLYSNDQLGEAHHGPWAVRMLSPEGGGSMREIRHLHWMSSTVPWPEPASPQMVWGSFLGKGYEPSCYDVCSAVILGYVLMMHTATQNEVGGCLKSEASFGLGFGVTGLVASVVPLLCIWRCTLKYHWHAWETTYC